MKVVILLLYMSYYKKSVHYAGQSNAEKYDIFNMG